MKVVITGAGKVGRHLAGDLSERGHDVTLIEQMKDAWIRAVEDIGTSVNVLLGDGCEPYVLEEAKLGEADVYAATVGGVRLSEPSADLADLLGTTFGGFPAFREQMTEAASTIQGSGWALASWEPVAGRLVVQQVHDHQGNHGQGTTPLLAIDAWEHAYYLQYQNRKTEFFDAIWNVVNWDDVAARLAACRAPTPR